MVEQEQFNLFERTYFRGENEHIPGHNRRLKNLSRAFPEIVQISPIHTRPDHSFSIQWLLFHWSKIAPEDLVALELFSIVLGLAG